MSNIFKLGKDNREKERRGEKAKKEGESAIGVGLGGRSWSRFAATGEATLKACEKMTAAMCGGREAANW